MIFIYILLAYLILYILYFVDKDNRIPKSLSDTAYLCKYKKTFLVTFWTAGIILFYPLSQISIPLSLLFTLGILLVGITPWYKNFNKPTHFVGGYLSGAVSQILVALVYPQLLLIWIPYILYAIFIKDDSKTFWAEIVCFANLFGILLI